MGNLLRKRVIRQGGEGQGIKKVKMEVGCVDSSSRDAKRVNGGEMTTSTDTRRGSGQV